MTRRANVTLLDRAVAWLSPRAGVERAYWRAAFAQVRGYEAAKVGRRTSGWIAGGGSANAEIGAAAQTLRARARDLVRNNPWSSLAVDKLAAKTVGIGIVPRAATADKALRRLYDREWSAFVESSDPEGRLDFYGQMNLLARTVFESGEALLRFRVRPSSWGLASPLQVEVLEPDWLDSSKTQRLDDGGAIIQGVQYDAAGRRTGYWLFDEHPGEIVPISIKGRYQSRFVPASEVLHVFKALRPGQARGITMFAPAAMRIRDTDDFDDAELVRKKIAACFAAFVQRSGDATSPLGRASADDSGRRLERLAPGIVQYLQPGEQVTFGEPPTADGYVDYMTLQLHAIAAGLGITYEMLTGDLSRVNYSSIRAGTIDFWDLLDQWQWLVFVPQACVPVWRHLDRLLFALGRLPQPGMMAKWAPPKRRLVDPGKEIAAERDAVRAGFKTLQQAIAELGEDPTEQIEEIAETNEMLDRLGLVLDSDPRKVSRAGLMQDRPDGEAVPPAKEE